MTGGEIMIGRSNNSGGVVVGALVCGTECSWVKSRFIATLIVFTCRNFYKFSRTIPARSQYSTLHQFTVSLYKNYWL